MCHPLRKHVELWRDTAGWVLQVSSVGASIADADSRCLASLLLLRDIQSTRMPLTNKSMHACRPLLLRCTAVWPILWLFRCVCNQLLGAHVSGLSSSMWRLDMHAQPADKTDACPCLKSGISLQLH